VAKHDPHSKAILYLCIIPRFKRMFVNPKDAKKLKWYTNEHKYDGLLRHPINYVQWKNINKEFSAFRMESCNLSVGSTTNGMDPYVNLSTNHSSWPVLLVIYNLPSGLSMMRKYMMLSMLIYGPREPINDIDVYLSSLIDDLKLLWDDGVKVFDAFANESF